MTYDLFDTEEFLDSRGGIGGADHQPKFRDYDEEIKELKIKDLKIEDLKIKTLELEDLDIRDFDENKDVIMK